jgi:hypothetical protein
MKHKYLLTVKVGLMALTVGLMGAVGALLPAQGAQAASSSVTVGVTVDAPPMLFSVSDPIDGQNVSKTIPVEASGSDISTVDVCIDSNDDGSCAGEVMVGNFNVDESAAFGPENIGTVVLPASTPAGEVKLAFVAHSKNSGADDIPVKLKVNLLSEAPVVTSVSPDLGPIEGGTDLTIRGNNFDNVQTVLVGGKTCLNIVVVNPILITCTAPAGTAGPADVTVTTLTGSAVKIDGYLYYSPTEPSIPGFPSLPMAPNTGGVFRLGNMAIKTLDVIALAVAFLILGVAIFLLVCAGKKKRGGKASKRPAAKRAVSKRPAVKRPAAKKAKKPAARKRR